jgi:hypothetical protein
MGILKDMYREMSGHENSESEEAAPSAALLAAGSYGSDAELVMAGYKLYQKRYVVPRVVLRLILVASAIASSIMMLMTRSGGVFSGLVLIISIAVGYYFITEPMGNRKKLQKSLELLKGVEYKAEIFTDKAVITTTHIPPELLAENEPQADGDSGESDGEDKNGEDKDGVKGGEVKDGESGKDGESEENADGDKSGNGVEDDAPPATIIHTDSHIVDFLSVRDKYIIVVRKMHVFVIPKSAFSPEELNAVEEKLPLHLGMRFKKLGNKE